jgi:hypothetical protein
LRAHGHRIQRVADLARFGIAAPDRTLWLELLGRLVGLQDARRLVVLRPDGSPIASTPLPMRRRRSDFLSGQPTASPGSGDVAFAMMHPDHRIETQVFERGVETVYLLRPGARAAVPIHTQPLRFNVCGQGADLSWHGRWLLYSTGEGNTAVVDTLSGGSIELTSLVRHLPGFRGDDSGAFRISWG